MARIIPFYVPIRLRDRLSRRARPGSRAKILYFVPGYRGKYVWLPSGALWPVSHQTPERPDRDDRVDAAG